MLGGLRKVPDRDLRARWEAERLRVALLRVSADLGDPLGRLDHAEALVRLLLTNRALRQNRNHYKIRLERREGIGAAAGPAGIALGHTSGARADGDPDDRDGE